MGRSLAQVEANVSGHSLKSEHGVGQKVISLRR